MECLDKTEARVESWLDVVAVVASGSDHVRKRSHVRGGSDSRLSEHAGRNSRCCLRTRQGMRKWMQRDTR